MGTINSQLGSTQMISVEARPAPKIAWQSIQAVRDSTSTPSPIEALLSQLKPEGVRRKIHLMFIGVNLLIAGLTVPQITFSLGVSSERRREAIIALAAIQAWLAFGYVLKRYPAPLDVVPLVGLIIVSFGFSVPFLSLGVFYNSLWPRSFAHSWRNIFVAAATYVTAYGTAEVLAGVPWPSPEFFGNAIGLTVMALIAKLMADTLGRGDHSLRVQHELSELGGALVAASDITEGLSASAEAALRLVSSDAHARVVIRFQETTLGAERAAGGRIVLTPGVPEPAPGENYSDVNVVVDKVIAGNIRLLGGRDHIKDLVQPLRLLATELGFGLEKVLLTDSLRRESQAKSLFLAMMSHELRTPLNSILGFAQLLTTPGFDPLTARQERFVDRIRTSGKHLLMLINDVLDLSKVAAGRLELSLESFEISDVVEAAVQKVMPVAETNGIELRHEARAVGAVMADPLRTEQIVLNLLSNAIKFTPRGGRVIARHRLRGEQIEVCIRDTGIGIPQDQLGRLFVAFNQLDAGRTRSHDGTGLGLALSRHLAEAMGGTISVVSSVGKGSAFMVSLPRASVNTSRALVGSGQPAESLNT